MQRLLFYPITTLTCASLQEANNSDVIKAHPFTYAYCSTMLGKDNEKFGWGVVSQVTGTAAWMDVVATQYLLVPLPP